MMEYDPYPQPSSEYKEDRRRKLEEPDVTDEEIEALQAEETKPETKPAKRTYHVVRSRPTLTEPNLIEDWADEWRSRGERIDQKGAELIGEIVGLGESFIAGKKELPHGSWLPALNQAGYDEDMAERHMAI